jgi:quercetin dioxygenase-like cupin family protein
MATLAAAVLLVMGSPARAAPDVLFGKFAPVVHWVHLYSGADGKSHLEDMPVPTAKGDNDMTVLFAGPATKFTIGYWPDGYTSAWHYATHLNILLYLQGVQILDLGDGQVHRLEPGVAVYAEDWTGLGHSFHCEAKTGQHACVVIQATLGEIDRRLPLASH